MKPGRAFFGVALIWCGLAYAASSCDEAGPGLTGGPSSGPGAGSGASGSTGSGGMPPAPLTREDYCDGIQKYCLEDDLQYENDATCMNVALKIPEGSAQNTTGNTIACRGVYVAQAAADPAANCRAAGPASDQCDTPCNNFCWLAATLCTGEQQQFADTAACRAACEDFAATPYASPTPTGDNFACRMYWLTQAANNPGDHCSKIATESVSPYSGEPVCVDPDPPPDGGMGGGGGGGGDGPGGAGTDGGVDGGDGGPDGG